MKLSLGSGIFPAPEPWINVDIWEDYQPDIVADIRDLHMIETGTVTHIYMGHVLEHLSVEDCASALTEARRVLQPGGLLCAVGPDADRCDPDDFALMETIIHGGDGGNPAWGDNPHSAHQWTCTGDSLYRIVAAIFPDAEPMDSLDDLAEWWPTVAREEAPWQCAVVANR